MIFVFVIHQKKHTQKTNDVQKLPTEQQRVSS